MDIEILSLLDFQEMPEIVEDGRTFEENALKKARVVAQFTGLPAFTDDSGLEVDYLGGAPGVFSNRFAGEKATYAVSATIQSFTPQSWARPLPRWDRI